MRPKKLFTLFLFLFLSVELTAQKGRIEGYIHDADSRSPLNGASINISGNKGDNSDYFGRFRIPEIQPGQYEIIVSHIGYKTAIIPVEVKASLLSAVTVNLKKADLDLMEVRVDSRKNSAPNMISGVDIKLRPVNTSQDVLRIVPGLFIAQHAGGGKAEQIFLRGYDIDHGTDINITVDGMPVNMVSHAHGQGYADLHFLIPETVEKVGFDKGPYNASKGNLATAAYIEFSTREFLDKNSVKLEAGQFNTQRAVGLLKLLDRQTEKNRQQFYIASEYSRTNGYFESPQRFHRFNIMGKYNAWFGNQSQLSIITSMLDSRWNASGQVPDRAVRSGRITRFGAIDDTEGGNTGRTNITVKYNRQWKNNWKTSDQVYYSRYHIDLFSNFTFFLEDSVNGDQLNQKEERDIFGYTSTAGKSYLLGTRKTTTEFGAGFRFDHIHDTRLSQTVKRQFLEDKQRGDIKEMNAFGFINQEIELSDKFTLNAGMRYDYFTFRYKDRLAGAPGFNRQRRGVISPKLNISYSPHQKLKLYFNNGIGFHSNDTRVILRRDASTILPRVVGTDLGLIAKPNKKMILKAAVWHLYSEQEFVYVGDAGVVEPGGKTRRMGIDLSGRYQIASWLFADIDLNLTRARAIGEVKGNDHVPLAPSFTSVGGLTVKPTNGFSGSLRYRYLADRPANETYSVTAKGYLITDAVITYQWKNWELKTSAENLFNIKWREAQFDTESRLQPESSPVSEIHYTPGSPFFIRAGVSVSF